MRFELDESLQELLEQRYDAKPDLLLASNQWSVIKSRAGKPFMHGEVFDAFIQLLRKYQHIAVPMLRALSDYYTENKSEFSQHCAQEGMAENLWSNIMPPLLGPKWACMHNLFDLKALVIKHAGNVSYCLWHGRSKTARVFSAIPYLLYCIFHFIFKHCLALVDGNH